MESKKDNNTKQYYYIDIDLKSRRIIGWDIEQQDTVEVNLPHGYHRIFLTKGQYNKFLKGALEI